MGNPRLRNRRAVEARTYQPYGATESDYRPDRWKGFREDYGFTGKEEDIEVGLQYFGNRYLTSYLGRWTSADPLAMHAPGKADLNLYAYVSASVLRAIDPLGLQSHAAGGEGAGPTEDKPIEEEASGSPQEQAQQEALAKAETADRAKARSAGFEGGALAMQMFFAGDRHFSQWEEETRAACGEQCAKYADEFATGAAGGHAYANSIQALREEHRNGHIPTGVVGSAGYAKLPVNAPDEPAGEAPIPPSRQLPPPSQKNPWMPGIPVAVGPAGPGVRINMAMSPGQTRPGAFGTLEPIPSVDFARNQLAIIPGFKADISHVQQFELHPSILIQKGIVGPQWENGVLYPGGGTQVQILNLSDRALATPVGPPTPIH